MNITNHDFGCIIDAMRFKTHCPMCSQEMMVNNDTNVYCKLYDNTLINESSDWTVKVSITGENASITENRHVLFMDSDFNGPFYSKISIAPSHIFGTQMMCSNIKCCRYYYIFSFRLDFNKKPYVSEIHVNTECMIFYDDDDDDDYDDYDSYEITSSYTSVKTRYKVVSSDINKGKLPPVEIPFIQFDYTNPNKTLEKVKSLIIFT